MLPARAHESFNVFSQSFIFNKYQIVTENILEYLELTTGIQNAFNRVKRAFFPLLNLEEDAMKALTRANNQSRDELNHETSHFSFTITTAAALLIGIWGAACFISDLISNVALAMLKGYISTITGF